MRICGFSPFKIILLVAFKSQLKIKLIMSLEGFSTINGVYRETDDPVVLIKGQWSERPAPQPYQVTGSYYAATASSGEGVNDAVRLLQKPGNTDTGFREA